VAGMLPGLVLFVLGALAGSVTLDAARLPARPRPVQAGYRRTLVGHVTRAIVGNPVMPLVTIGAVIGFVVLVAGYYAANGKGTEFFVATEPEQGIVYVRARGNLSLAEKDAILREAERIILDETGVAATFAFAGQGGLNSNTGGAQAPRDSIGQAQIELTDWAARTGLPGLGGRQIIDRLQARLDTLPGVKAEIALQTGGPASGKPVHLRLTGDDFSALSAAVQTVSGHLATLPGLTGIEDTRPLPGIDWQVKVDVEAAGRFGADVAIVGGMVQLVTRGLLLDTMRVDSSDEEIDIRVRLPETDRLLATLDSLRINTRNGLVPLSNFVTREPVPRLARIDRVDQSRYFDVRAAVLPGLTDAEGRPINANERIARITDWLETARPLPAGVAWEWVGDQQDQQESADFLMKAFAAALGLMFIILLAQFNSLYNSVLVLTAVVLSTAGVLIGMLVMDQTFSFIMTGTGVVALAGIVVNNNIILIDTYQDLARQMPRIEAIIRTVETRLRPVLLTTITTMAGLLPMMLGLSFDFANGGYTVDSPTAIWWKQLATAVVFGLGVATVLTLLFTPAMLALRVWLAEGAYGLGRRLAALTGGKASAAARDLALARAVRQLRPGDLIWIDVPQPPAAAPPGIAPPAPRAQAAAE
jgi:multidrug efflux pump